MDPLDFSGYEQLLNSRPPAVTSVRLRFFYHPQQNHSKSEEAGRPIFDQVEKVSIINPGSRDEWVGYVTDDIRAEYSSAYEHWRRTQQQPSDGTPLEEVPFLNAAQVKELRALSIESLEHLAGLTDALKQRIGMGANELVRKAQNYLAAAAGHAADNKAVTENEELRRRIAYLEQNLTAANQRYETLLAGTPPAAPSPAVPAPQQPPPVDVAAIALAVAQILKASAPEVPATTPEQQFNAEVLEPQLTRRRRQ